MELWKEWHSGTCGPRLAKSIQCKSATPDICHAEYKTNDGDIAPASKEPSLWWKRVLIHSGICCNNTDLSLLPAKSETHAHE